MKSYVKLKELPYSKKIRRWVTERYGDSAEKVWKEVCRNYYSYQKDMPDYGGRKNGHFRAIYGGLLVFAWYAALPDHPPIEELQGFVQDMFMGSFTTLGKVFDLNRPTDMRIIDTVFRRSGDRDRKDAEKYPDGFINVDHPYDSRHRAASYKFTQCPNAKFAKKHDMLHVLPLMCNCDYFGISQIHGLLVRHGTCGNASVCDYLIIGDKSPIAARYETLTDDKGFLITRHKK
ncbi:MAG: L-2-amino-thiazoline-4-carboxylic acid hydrolase [Oscillospiraceae bacterium]|nr:L-2-amino-thiazoline-4-carboxylic acid hydrolase [Oscillospiraceae bacterium]